jgi:multiple sugar transport system permease protein
MASQQKRLKRSSSDYVLLGFTGLAAVITMLLIVAPILSGMALSFFKISSFSVSSTPKFVELSNYERVLGDGSLFNALRNGLVFSLSSIVVQLALALAVALLLNTQFYGRGVVRTALILPMLVPPVVVTILFKWMTNETFGIVPAALRNLGFDSIAWHSPDMAMVQVVLLGMWLWAPFMIVSILAELQSIPPTLYEASRVDGATPVQQFFHITLPHLANVIGIILLLRMIWTFNNFDLIWLTTGGGPLGLTETMSTLSYRQSFLQFNIGAGAATATIAFLTLLSVVIVAMKFLPAARDD